MKVNISTQRGNFTANLKLPRALVLSIAATIAGLVGNAVHTAIELRDVKHQLAECNRRIDAQQSSAGVQ